MIFEYMAYGDLTEVLRNSNDQFMNRSSNLPIVDKVSAEKVVNLCIYTSLQSNYDSRLFDYKNVIELAKQI